MSFFSHAHATDAARRLADSARPDAPVVPDEPDTPRGGRLRTALARVTRRRRAPLRTLEWWLAG